MAGNGRETVWTGDHPPCDIHLQRGERVRGYADGRTVFGPWAVMCRECFGRYGTGTGIGNGQVITSATGRPWADGNGGNV